MSLRDTYRAIRGLRGMGLRHDPHDPRDWGIDKLLGAAEEIPDAHASVIDERVQPKQQGRTDSCTGQAIAQAIRIDALANGRTLPDLSASHNYFLGRAEWGAQKRDDGSFIRAGIKAGERYGFAAEVAWPFVATKINKQPDWVAMKDGIGRRGVRGYYRIADGDVGAIDRALSARHPVVGGWPVGKRFLGWDGRAPLAPEQEIAGWHAMVVCSFGTDGIHWLLNSWGQWGRKGYAVVTEDFVRKGQDLWVVAYS